MSRFADFLLLPTLQATLSEQRMYTPTEIQSRTLPLLLQGRAVVGVSETGSGKTLAYVLPVLHLMKTLENESGAVTVESRPRAVVIVPTRELGDQVTRVFKPFTHSTRLRVRSLLGGTTMEIARRNVKGPVDVLVATPGRLVQFMAMGRVCLDDVRFLVFDEADQMLDQGFLPDAQIAGACPAERQLALYSATLSTAVEKLIGSLFAGAEIVRTEGSHQVVETLRTVNEPVSEKKRFPLLQRVLTERFTGGTIIFTNTRSQCDELAQQLVTAGHRCAVYRGDMDRVERRANLRAFSEGRIPLLVSTDLGSRGLDVERVERVINYRLPHQPESYLHRVGRTARAGRPGIVVNFVTDRDVPLMKRLR